MEALGAAASVVTIIEVAKAVYSSCQKYILGVKHARQEIQRLSAEVLELSDTLERVDELLKSPSASKLPTLHRLQKPGGAFRQCEHQLKHILSKLEPAEGTQAIPTRALKWPFRSENVREAIEALERQKSVIELALGIDHVAVTLNVDAAVSQLRDDLSSARIQEDGLRMSKEDKELRDKVIIWLSTTDPSTNHVNQRRKHQATTGDWFVHGNELEQWRTKPNALLWLYGTSGCGKTVLSSTIIEHIKDKYLTNHTFVIAYYYFDFNESEKQKALNFVSSITSQLCAQRASLSSHARDLYIKNQQGHHTPLLPDLLQTLGGMIKDYHIVYIVIDALDECPQKNDQRDELLQIIEDIHNWNMPQLRILVTSREEGDITELLKPLLTSPAISIQSQRVSADIQLHVQNELRDIAKKRRWTKDLVNEIEEVLVHGANGMFRWISCQLDTLKLCLKPSQVRLKLKSLPKDLEETYARILLELPEDYREDACTALRWLCYSEQPLNLEELVEALLLVPNKDPPFNPEDRLSDPHAVLQILPGLVSISRVQVLLGHEIERIRLAHFSVKEYLVGKNIQRGPTAVFGTTPEHAHQFITESCLVYILAYHEAGERTDSFQDLKSFPLLKYSCSFWYVHRSRFVGEDETDAEPQTRADKLMMQILLSIDKLKSWVQVHQPVFQSDAFVHRNGLNASLYYAASIGLCSAVRLLLDHGVDPNARLISLKEDEELYDPFRCRNPLSVAARNGKTTICRLLISGGARVEDKPTALNCAAAAGQASTVRFLLQNGAHVDAETGENPPLVGATYFGHQEVMRVLIEYGADVNAMDEHGATALDSAAQSGDCDMIRLLLDGGANRDSRNNMGQTPLIHAAFHGRVDAIKLLDERGADLTARDSDRGRTSLNWAALAGHYAIVERLLELLVDIEAVDKRGQTSLHMAASEGRTHVARLLLEHGANANAEDDTRATPLHEAVSKGMEHVIKLLLWDPRFYNGGSAEGFMRLHIATIEDVIKLLLEHGANVNAEDDARLTPLHAAARWGLESIVRVVELECSARHIARSDLGATPLYEPTASWAHESIVRLLLEHGADVNAKDDAGLTPKDFAAEYGVERILNILQSAEPESGLEP